MKSLFERGCQSGHEGPIVDFYASLIPNDTIYPSYIRYLSWGERARANNDARGKVAHPKAYPAQFPHLELPIRFHSFANSRSCSRIQAAICLFVGTSCGIR